MRIFRNRHMRWPWLTTLGYDRQKISSFRWYGRMALLVFVVMVLSSMRQPVDHAIPSTDRFQGEIGPASRHLLSATSPTPTTDCDSINLNASAHGLSWEQCDFELANVKEIWVLIHAFGIFIIFVALAIICDDFFVPSLEAISEKLRLSEDVAGATFMAAGSSAPELFTSIVGVAFETDVGVGTIVGSAVFNILIIIALTAALAGQVLALDWRPIARDGFYYGVSIALFIAFSWDGTIEMYEAVVLLVLYILYIVVMVFNQRLMDFLGSFQRRSSMVEPTANGNVETSESQTSGSGATKKMSMTGGHARRLSVLSQTHRSSLHDIQADKHVFHHTHHGGLAGNFRVLASSATRTSSWTDLRSAGDSGKHYLRNCPRPHSLTSDTRPQALLTGELVELSSYQNGRRNSADAPLGQSQVVIRPSTGSANFVVTEYLKDSSRTYAPIPDAPDRLHDMCATSCSPQSYFTFHQHVTSPDSTANPQARHPSVIEERDDERSSTPNEPKSTDTEPEEEIEPTIRIIPCLPAIRTSTPSRPLKGAGTKGAWFCYVVKVILFIISFPFVILFSWTIPDCSKDHNRKYFLASFLMSVIWIAVLSVGMVTLVARTGCILGVDHYTMGLVIVAVGTSVPDALSSILVGRDGYGDMAVSNAIGSNVFDIDLGLGLPFILTIAIRGPVKLLGPLDECLMNTGALIMTQHAKFGFILMFILLLTICTFALARFKLTRSIGIVFVSLYVIFLIYAFVQEFVCHGVYC